MTSQKLINAHDLWSDIMMLPHNGDMISSEDVEQAIKEAIAVEAREVVHGQWVRTEIDLGDGIKTHRFVCSVCEYMKNTLTGNYCPNCGAKMDLKE